MPVLTAVSPLDPTTGSRVTLRFADNDDPRVTGLNDLKWWPGVARAPVLNREVFNGDFSGSVAIAQAAMNINLHALRKLDTNAPFYRYAGAPMSIWYAASITAVWADYELIFAGLVSDHGIDSGVMSITSLVDSEPFDADLLSRKYGGTGAAEGIEDLKDKVKPMVFGYAKNVEPVMINTVDNIFQVHGYGPIEDVVAVYERALDFGASLGDYATYALLRDADIPEGSWATCRAEGMFRLGAPPFGVITVDVKGDNTGGWHRTTAAIIQRVCDIAAVDPARIDSASLTAFATACPEPINLDLGSSTSLLDVIQQLAMPCNAQASLSWTGKLQITRFGAMPTSSTITLDAQGRQLPPVLSNAEQGVSPPFWRLEMLADRCWRVQSKDEIAFFDDDGPVTIYRRYPEQPPTPTGDDVPAGWSATPPTYTAPVNDNSFDQFGPIWSSTAMQHAGITSDDGWSAAVLADPAYQGWVLVSQNVGAKVLGTVNGLKAADDFDPDVDTWPYCFINRPVTGPFTLQCRVKQAADRIAVGVVPYTPVVLNGGFQANDLQFGVYVAQDDNYATQGQFGEHATGAFIIQNYDPNSDFLDGRDTVVLEAPVDNCLMEMIFNGETVDFYVNGVRVRTTVVNQSWFSNVGLEFWAAFIPLSADAEITDIRWARGTQARELDFRCDISQGCGVRSTTENGWLAYTPGLTVGSDCAIIYSKAFIGGCSASTKCGDFDPSITPDTDTFNIFSIGGVAQITFYADGTFDCFRLDQIASALATGSWLAGEVFSISFVKQTWYGFGSGITTNYMIVKHNGTQIAKKKMSPPSVSQLILELGAGGMLYDIDFATQGAEVPSTSKATANGPALLTPITDATTTVTGGYIVLSETGDIPWTAASDPEDVVGAAEIKYTKTAGAAASFTPDAKLEYSLNQGGSWSSAGSSVTGAASTTTQQTLDIARTVSVSGSSGTIRFRLLVKNTITGTYTVTTTGYLTTQWAG